MRVPTCPTHGRLVLDLALGRLADDAAAEAENVRSVCTSCATWWREELEGPEAAELEHVLSASFASFVPPARRRMPRWMSVAAAATLAVGAGLVWYQHRSDPQMLTKVQPTAVSVATFDGDSDGNGSIDVTDSGFVAVHAGAAPEDAIFADSLDNGDLTGWTPHT